MSSIRDRVWSTQLRPVYLPETRSGPTAPRFGDGATGWSAMLAPPCSHYLSLAQHSNAKESRKLALRRSVFDLVAFHRGVALTDTELLGWYLSLSAEDRALILEEGGLQPFLRSHPGLVISQGHVYVETRLVSVQPTVTANQKVFPRLGSQNCGYEICEQMFEMLPGDTRRNLTWIEGSNSANRSRELCDKASDSPGVHQISYSLPLTQEQRQHKGSSTLLERACISPDMSLDMELERCRHRERSEDSVSPGQNASSTTQLQSEGQVEEPSDDGLHTEDSVVHPVCLQQTPTGGPAPEHQVLASKETTDNHAETRLSSGADGDQFNRVDMKHDGSILLCLVNNNLTVQNADTPVQPVSVTSLPPSASGGATMCDATRNTKVESCTTYTQTESPNTAEQNVMTEVQMADLDCVAKEFIRLQKLQQCRETKEKMGRNCRCAQRAEQAELALLSLHYHLCRQHVWRLYHVSAEGHQPINIAKAPPPNIARILQKLETDYNVMKRQILTGVPLEQLSPLCVESDKVTTGACYVPAQIVTDLMGNAPPCPAQGRQKKEAGDSLCPEDDDRASCQKEDGEARGAAAVVASDRFIEQIGCEEQRTAEVWFDAEEELQLPGPAAADNGESVRDESSCSVLYVSNLPDKATQSDVMQLFSRFQPSNVSISTLKSDVRVAMVTVDGPEAAEAAVRELNGHRWHNHTLHITHLSGAAGGGHPSASTCVSLQDAAETDSRLPEKKLMPQALLVSRVPARKVVSILPTAEGPCVPPHFGTMASLETLMAELTQRHPQAERQRILEAVMEVKTMHRALDTIRDMTSDLLTKAVVK